MAGTFTAGADDGDDTVLVRSEENAERTAEAAEEAERDESTLFRGDNFEDFTSGEVDPVDSTIGLLTETPLDAGADTGTPPVAGPAGVSGAPAAIRIAAGAGETARLATGPEETQETVDDVTQTVEDGVDTASNGEIPNPIDPSQGFGLDKVAVVGAVVVAVVGLFQLLGAAAEGAGQGLTGGG